jgi:uncharacterized membrane protein YfhO
MKQKSTQRPESKSPVKKEAKIIVHKPAFLEKYLEKYPLQVAMGLVSLLILIVFHNFIAGNIYYLFKDIGSDTLNTFFPHFIYVNQYFRTEGIPLWTFAQGMGQNIQSISLNDPFYLIIYLFDASSVAYFIVWMEIIKILVTAVLIYHVLRCWKLKPVYIIIGTLLYCFSSFMIVGGGWYIFSTEACFLALMLLGFEKLYQQGSWYIFPFSITLIAAFQPFNLFLYGLFLILYFLLRFFTSDQKTTRDFYSMVLKLAGFTLLGLLISSFFLWSGIQVLLDSPRVGGSSGYFNKLMSSPVFAFADSNQIMTTILRFFSSDILGHGTNYKGWYNYLESPLFYIGFLPLLLMPQIFALSNKRKTIIYAIFLTILMIPVIFPYFRYAIWLFSGDYYRGFSFFVGLAFLFLTLFGLNELSGTKKVNLIVLAGTLLFLIILLYYPYKEGNQRIDDDVRSVSRNFLLIYGIIAALSYWDGFKPYFGATLLFFVFIELGYVNYSNLSSRSVITSRELKDKVGYNDYSMECSQYINSFDKQFFRVNKNFNSTPSVHTSFNDAKAQGYYGTQVYGSFNQKYYVRFLEEIGVIKKGNENESRWIVGLANRPLLQNLASTKYCFAKGDIMNFIPFGYDSITRFGDVKVLRNKYFLPLGFTYNKYISLDTFSKISDSKKDFILQKAFVAENPVDSRFQNLNQLSLRDTAINYQFTDYYNDVALLKRDTLAITHFAQNRIKGKIELDSARLLFLSIPYDKGWHAKVNGKEVTPLLCNIGFLGLFLDPGKHEIELSYTPPFYHLSLILTVIGLLVYAGLFGLNKFFASKKKVNVPD